MLEEFQELTYGTIERCTNKLNINGITNFENDNIFIGGIAGSNRNTIKLCENDGDIEGEGSGQQTQTGGICGFNNCYITSCYNKGKVTGRGKEKASQVYVGGIVGINWIEQEGELKIEKCYNMGDVHGEYGYYTHIGGIVGHNDMYGNVSQCCNVSYVTAIGAEDATNPYSGGICGHTKSDNTAIIKECYYFNRYINNGVGYGAYEEEEIMGINNINDIPSVKEITGYDF